MERTPGRSKKKILYVITKSSPFGGAQRYVYDLATNASSGYEVVVALGGGGELKNLLDEKDVRTVVVRALQRDISFVKEVQSFAQLFAVIRRERPDIVHVNSSKAGGLGAVVARFLRTPVVVFTSHGLAFEEDWPRLERLVILFFSWLTFLFVHRIIVISQSNKERVCRMPFISPNKVRLVYNAITEPTFVGRESARRFLKEQTKKEKHVFPSRATWIGTISELCRNKGLEHLIWAVRDVVERNPKTLCIIVGEGELRPSLTQLIGHLGLEKHVFLAGYVVNAASYLKALDIFTLTSVKEGHPYTLLEAGWAGSAVVGSDIPGITDTVDDMSSGVLVRPGNSQEIAEALELLIKSPEKRKEFGDSLKKTVTERFSLEAMIAATQKVYEC